MDQFLYPYLIGIVGTKQYRKPEWVTQMEEMQEALRGKNKNFQQTSTCVRMFAFSSDSLDEKTTYSSEESPSLQDSSTIVSELSSTKNLTNIEDPFRSESYEFYLPKIYINDTDSSNHLEQSKSIENIFQSNKTELDENKKPSDERNPSKNHGNNLNLRNINKNTFKTKITDYEINREEHFPKTIVHTSKTRRISLIGLGTRNTNYPEFFVSRNRDNINKKLNLNQRRKMKLSSLRMKRVKIKEPSRLSKLLIQTYLTNERKDITDHLKRWFITKNSKSNVLKKSVSQESKNNKQTILDFGELAPTLYELNMCSTRVRTCSEHKNLFDLENTSSSYYLSPIEENSEASSNTSKKKCIPCSQNVNVKNKRLLNDLALNRHDSMRKYHTYPKSRIPIPRKFHGNYQVLKSLHDPKMYPLEPREIELEGFQQLHTADSQEELQEFLLLESQCSGDLSLAENKSNSENEYGCNSEEERATMSGIFASTNI